MGVRKPMADYSDLLVEEQFNLDKIMIISVYIVAYDEILIKLG